jgi:transposase
MNKYLQKTRVFIMADKELKRLLHMAALCSIQLPGELRGYYLRKVGEDKNKMVVINAIRNIIIARICSGINNKKKYQVYFELS